MLHLVLEPLLSQLSMLELWLLLKLQKKKKNHKKRTWWRGVALRHIHLATFSYTVLAVVCLLHLCK